MNRYNRRRVYESTITSLPTRMTPVNATKRKPHIRDQHVRTDELISKAKSSNNPEQSTLQKHKSSVEQPSLKMNIDDKNFVFHRYTTDKGNEVNLDIKIYTPDTTYERAQARKQGINEETIVSDFINKNSFGYISSEVEHTPNNIEKPYSLSNAKLSKSLIKDMGLDKIMDAVAPFTNSPNFSLSIGFKPDKGIVYNLNYENPSDGIEANYIGSLKVDKNTLHTEAQYCVLQGRGKNNEKIESTGVGTEVHAQQQKTFMNIVHKNNLDKHISTLEAGLEAGAYIWGECGYNVSKEDRNYIVRSFERSYQGERKIAGQNEGLCSENKKNALYLKFMKSGNPEYLKERIKADYGEGAKVPYGSADNLYRNIMAGQTYTGYIIVNKGDSPKNNQHLARAERRAIYKLGKKLFS